MKPIIRIDDKLINLDRIHFVRLESESELIISFGPDFIRIRKSPEELESILNKIQKWDRDEGFSRNRQ